MFPFQIYLIVLLLLESAIRLAVSTGSACSSGVPAPSHVLRAMSLSDELIEGSLRIGLGKFTTNIEIEKSVKIISNAVEQVFQAMHI